MAYKVTIREPIGLSSLEIHIPQICPCCGESISNQKDAVEFVFEQHEVDSYTDVVRSLKFPYCKECRKHVSWHEDGAIPGLIKRSILYYLILAVVIGLLVAPAYDKLGLDLTNYYLIFVFLVPLVFIFFYAKKQLRSHYLRSPGKHASADEWAVSISRGSYYSDIDLEFLRQDYAEAFAEMNDSAVKRK